VAALAIPAHAIPRQTTRWSIILVTTVAGGAIVLGLFMRLWLIFHMPDNSDNAVSELIARAAMHGHFQAFYGGQSYGGTAEPILVAIAFLVFGQSNAVAELLVTALIATSGVLVWRAGLRLVSPRLALLAGALAWAAPAVAVRDSTRVAFRGVTAVCGVAMILLALRFLDEKGGPAGWIALGLFAGVGWWCTPEIVYFVVPTFLIVGAALMKTPRIGDWWWRVAAAIAGFVVGALPWLWANFGSHFASLNAHPTATFGQRFTAFFQDALPMELGLRQGDYGTWFFGQLHLVVFYAVLLLVVAAVVLCLARGGRSAALASGVVAFPFLYAIFPDSALWQDGRYMGFFVPLLALVMACGIQEAGGRVILADSAITSAMGVLLVAAAALSAFGMHQLVNTEAGSFIGPWGNADSPTQATIARLEAAGVTTGYANYWVAYKLDFLSGGRLSITVAGYEEQRDVGIASTVAHSPDPAWLFVPPNEQYRDAVQFTAPGLITGPDTVTEAQFELTLHELGVGYRVVDTGILRAVIPAHALTPVEAKVPGAIP
jgi:hypothetical protein